MNEAHPRRSPGPVGARAARGWGGPGANQLPRRALKAAEGLALWFCGWGTRPSQCQPNLSSQDARSQLAALAHWLRGGHLGRDVTAS